MEEMLKELYYHITEQSIHTTEDKMSQATQPRFDALCELLGMSEAEAYWEAAYSFGAAESVDAFLTGLLLGTRFIIWTEQASGKIR